jgi:hypothetical protein
MLAARLWLQVDRADEAAGPAYAPVPERWRTLMISESLAEIRAWDPPAVQAQERFPSLSIGLTVNVDRGGMRDPSRLFRTVEVVPVANTHGVCPSSAKISATALRLASCVSLQSWRPVRSLPTASCRSSSVFA